jgi:CPA1 family monovalent cation:H+ antiporter
VGAVTARLPLPSRVTHIVNGESLINDASGLVAFKFAVAAVATGAFSWTAAAGEFLVLSGGGLVAGVAIAWLVGEARVRLARFCVDDPTIQTLLSLLTPYAAYLAAESLHVSGILAVVAAGLYAGTHDSRNVSRATRQHAWEVWAMVLFIGNGLVFLLLGAQLRPVLAALDRASFGALAGYALALFVLLIVIRLLWVYPAAYLPHLLSRRIHEREGRRDPGHVFLVGWAGIRGSVTMAAALSIPLVTANGSAFPGRDLIIFLAATTIVLTLVVNGLTLPLFIRLLGVRGDRRAEHEERAARLATTQAAIDTLHRELGRTVDAEETVAAQRLIAQYERRLARHSANAERRAQLDAREGGEQRLALAALAAEQAELQSLRDTAVINDETLRLLQVDLDHAESMLRGTPREGH